MDQQQIPAVATATTAKEPAYASANPAMANGLDASPRQGEQLYARLFAQLADGCALCQVLCDGEQPVDLVWQELNPAFERLTGLCGQDLLGRRVSAVFADLALGAEDWLELLCQVAARGEPLHLVRYSTCLQRWFQVSAHRLAPACLALILAELSEPRQNEQTGQPSSRAPAAHLDDISSHKQIEKAWRHSEKILRAHMENSPLAVIEFDPQFRITRWSRGATKLFGWTTEETLGHTFEQLPWVFPEDVETISRVSASMFNGEQSQSFHTNRNFHKDGRLLYCEWYNSAIYDRRGGLVSLLSLVLDVTEHKTAEQQRELFLAQIQEANEAKDLFFNTLSHELRTPLAAMTNAVELLKKPELTKSHRTRSLGILERNIKHQAHLIEDLLDLSRIMRGKVELEEEPLDLRELVKAQLDAMEGQAYKARLSLELQAPQPVPVVGDGVRLGQVIVNLLNNAIKFTEAGGWIKVEVGLEGDQAVLITRDSGVGISPELLPQIFEPFRQGDVSLSRTRGGLGIGLAISRSLVELHSGTLTAESAGHNKGCTVSMRLPLACPATDDALSAWAAPPLPLEGRRVLLIEDNEDLRDSLVLLLEANGHTAIPAAEGASGLQLARAELPDVALVDIGLPDIDGYQLAQRLRADDATKGLCLIALTGYATPEHRQRALAAGFDYHVAKPITADELEQLLRYARLRPHPRSAER